MKVAAVVQLTLFAFDHFEVDGELRSLRSPARGRVESRRRRADQLALPLPKRKRREVLRDNLRRLADREVPPLPATRGDCLTEATNPRVSGICPKFSCRHNLALWVKDNGAIKVEGAAGDTNNHPTIRSHRRVSDRTLEHVADMIIARADRLGISLCVLDLADAIAAERVKLRTLDKDHSDTPDWTYALIARILVVSAERARVLGHGAAASLRAKLIAAGLGPEDADGDDAQAGPDPAPPARPSATPALATPSAPLVQIRRKPKPPESCK